MRDSAAGTRTRFRSSMTRPRASVSVKRSCAVMASSIWKPTFVTGFSEVIGSWKIIAPSLPRTSRISSSSNFVTSRPRNMILPAVIRPGSGTSLRIESAVIVLPQPDSPTMPSVSPASMCSETPSTARTTPREVKNCVCRSSTCSRIWPNLTPELLWLALHTRVERVAQPVAHKREREHGERHRDAGEDHLARVSEDSTVSVLDHHPPARLRRPDADAQEAQRRLGEDRCRDAERQRHDHGTERVGHQVLDDELERRRPGHDRRFYVLLLLDRQDLAADKARQSDPIHKAERDEDAPEARPESGHENQHQEQIREGVHDVGEPHQEVVDPPSEVAGGHADAGADEHNQELTDDPDRQRDRSSVENPRQLIATEDVGTQGMLERREGIRVDHVLRDRVCSDVEDVPQAARGGRESRAGRQHDHDDDDGKSPDRQKVAPEADPGCAQ